jgi:2-oxo-4-hydroxy-4-carboxy-5-ureidoimidazoline decarboxylase
MTDSALARFNALPPGDAEHELLACCASTAFAGAVAARRPYPAREALVRAADAAVRELSWEEVLRALAGHPRIGERSTQGWSRQEQSGVEDELRDRLAEANRAYERRFGHVYLVCATGLTGAEMLRGLRERLEADETAERRTVRDELAKITRLRAGKLLGEDG